ncbi:MAG: ribonuclease J [Lachnospiraceae bacterium]|nr:ribonuclease J [Lachnospiraceae bacterium]
MNANRNNAKLSLDAVIEQNIKENHSNNTKNNNSYNNSSNNNNNNSYSNKNKNYNPFNYHNKNKKKSGKAPYEKQNKNILLNYRPNPNAKVRIIPLGGLDEIGMNITLIETEKDIVVVDCGIAFPGEDLPGVDLIIPDISYLKQHKDKIRGMVFTHGHEDHVGAVPYIIDDMNVPMYGTKLTCAIIEGKLKEHKKVGYKLNVVQFGDIVKLGNIQVEFIRTNHSIVDSSALAIYTDAGIIMHTGDFKVDYTPVFGDAIDLNHIAEIGSKGVLALLSDSTNAIKPGFTMSERTVGNTFDVIFNEHIKERIIVATFASNVDRVRQIIDTAYRYGRKVAIQGRSMVSIINTAIELGYMDIPKGTLIDSEMITNYPDNKTVIITTGSQGESMAALSRMAQNTNKKINIKPGDVVILSSTPIPGNEKAVARVINELSRKHAKVIYQDTHVSGHACAEEIKLIYTLVNPKYAVPVHGEYRHRLEATSLAESVGVDKDKCILLDVGDVLELKGDTCKTQERVQSGEVYVDGLGVGDVGNIVLKDRQMLATSGVIIVALTLSHDNTTLLSGPDIISKGFTYMKDQGELIDNMQKVCLESIQSVQQNADKDWKKYKSKIGYDLSDYLWKTIKRRPLIIPVIMNA